MSVLRAVNGGELGGLRLAVQPTALSCRLVGLGSQRQAVSGVSTRRVVLVWRPLPATGGDNLLSA